MTDTTDNLHVMNRAALTKRLVGKLANREAVIGGIGNLYGAMLGGLVLGLLESFGTSWFGGQWRDVFAFGFLILFLVFKPTGILGRPMREKV